MRYRIWEFAMDRVMAGSRPEWLWDWLANVTYVSAYEPVDDGKEIPF
jgi:hypothetical protein